MLLRLLSIRFLPLLLFMFLKERKKIQKAAIVILEIYLLGFCFAVWKLLTQYRWFGILTIVMALFPHYLCYGFAGWILARCLWFSWSKRVWKRIVFVSLFSVLAGIFMEKYWNLNILQIFFEIFK